MRDSYNRHPVLSFLSDVGLFSLSLLHLLLTRIIPLLALLTASLLSQLFSTLLSVFSAASTSTKRSQPHRINSLLIPPSPSPSSSSSSSSLASSSPYHSEEEYQAEESYYSEEEGLEEEEEGESFVEAEVSLSSYYNPTTEPPQQQQPPLQEADLSANDSTDQPAASMSTSANPDAEIYHDVQDHSFDQFDDRPSSPVAMADTDSSSSDQSINHTTNMSDRNTTTSMDTPNNIRPRALPPTFSDVERRLRQLKSSKNKTTSD